jgi:FtsP/CotA-like multicopper oxidase with cupredoxin domain
MKVIGGDSGRCEHEQLVDAVLLAPSERAVVDVLFAGTAHVTLEHRTPAGVSPLATIAVSQEPATPSLATEFATLRSNADMVAERTRIAPYLEAEPDRTVALVAEMDMGEPVLPPGAQVAYVCPMHPEVISAAPGRCPRCGMKLMATELTPDDVAGGHGHEHAHEDVAAGHGHEHAHGDAAGGGHGHDGGGIEWEDDMVEVNRTTTSGNTRWKLIDRATGAEGHAIDWRFRVGDQVKIRLVNEMDSDHPMHHPFHVHGAGRFLVLARDGVAEPNLVWKDTVLVPTGQTVDILLDVTNPGLWMAHCHIAEHHESGMMFRFVVDP